MSSAWVDPPRVPAGQAGGGRFATAECPTTYRLLAALRPAGEPWPDPTQPGRYVCPAPRCPHGHFRRWADAVAEGCKVQRNCRSCHPPRSGPRSLRDAGEGG